MNQNRPNFFLHFTKELEARELVMRGGENDPLEYMPTTQIAPVNQLQHAMFHPTASVPPMFNFRVDDTNDCRIIRGLSPGKRNEIYSVFLSHRSPTRVYCECVPFDNVPGTNT